MFPENLLKMLLKQVVLQAAILLQRKKHPKFHRPSNARDDAAAVRHRSELQFRTIAI
ncbi:hypothetical protein BOSE21B_90688 [Bosea sp. 21B]|nr:hypothetical protein BOSE7B_50803 [Bosea sp. 7B]CAD5297726.1 hypothetical protein BOSE21B_90688 [Bosea sp. 21B]